MHTSRIAERPRREDTVCMMSSASAQSTLSAQAPASAEGTTADYRHMVVLPLLAAVGGAACLIIMGEIDRLIASSVGTSGQSRPLSAYIGVTGFSASDSWNVWASAAISETQNFPVGSWINLSVVVDFAFNVCYGYLLSRVAGLGNASKLATWSIRSLIFFDLTENLMLFWCVNVLDLRVGPKLWWWPWMFCGLKWLAAVFALLVLVRSRKTSGAISAYFGRLVHSLYTHRLALVVVAMLGILSLLPLGNIFDQLPDVQRQWLDDIDTGLRHGFWAVFTAILLSLGFFKLGRLRSLMEWNKYVYGAPPNQHPRMEPWLAAIAFVLLGLWISSYFTGSVSLEALWYLIVPVIVLVMFWAERFPFIGEKLRECRKARDDEVSNERKRVSEEKDKNRIRAKTTETTGDVISVLVICISCLGLVRAFTAPVVLIWENLLPGVNRFWPTAWFSIGIIGALGGAVLGMRLAVGIPGGAGAKAPLGSQSAGPGDGYVVVQDSSSRGDDAQGIEDSLRRGQVGDVEDSSTKAGGSAGKSKHLTPGAVIIVVNIAVSSVILIGTAVFPFQVAECLGAAAMTLVALGAWSLFLGTIQIALQQQRPPFIFYVARFRAVPLMTLLFVVPFILNLNGGAAGVHAIRSSDVPPSASTAPRGDKGLTKSLIDPAWNSWVSRPKTGCDKSFEGQAPSRATQNGVQTHIRPLLLVAAQGGGIRAAYWTGRTMEAISRSAPCISDSILLASGVSGSSVGLVVASLAEKPNDGAITKSLDQLSDSKTLSTAMAGYLAGDAIAAVSGVRVPSKGDGPAIWHDRAALIEISWESREKSLKNTFSYTPSKSTGALVLNSTDSVSGCRVIVAQQEPISMSRSEQAANISAHDREDLKCDAAGMGTAAALSFQDLTGSASCMADLHWSTAAMLSARFPFVTPAGRLPEGDGECSSTYKAQLVDGGYADNTGLATLFDMVPEIRERVMRSNSTATGPKENPFVFPVLLYVANSLGSDIDEKGKMTAEFLVPLRDKEVKEKQMAADAWIQRVATGLEDVCPPGKAVCDHAHSDFHNTIPAGVVVVSPATRPAIAPPLGWTLSGLSRSNLCKGLETEITATGTSASFGRLGDLFSLTRTEDHPSMECPG